MDAVAVVAGDIVAGVVVGDVVAVVDSVVVVGGGDIVVMMEMEIRGSRSYTNDIINCNSNGYHWYCRC